MHYGTTSHHSGRCVCSTVFDKGIEPWKNHREINDREISLSQRCQWHGCMLLTSNINAAKCYWIFFLFCFTSQIDHIYIQRISDNCWWTVRFCVDNDKSIRFALGNWIFRLISLSLFFFFFLNIISPCKYVGHDYMRYNTKNWGPVIHLCGFVTWYLRVIFKSVGIYQTEKIRRIGTKVCLSRIVNHRRPLYTYS